MQIKDIVAGKKYLSKNGEEKTKWVTVGRLFIKDDGKMVVKFEEYINPIAFKNEKGDIWFNVFEQKAENAPKTPQRGQPYTEPTAEEKERVMADGRTYSDHWRKQAQGQETIIDCDSAEGTMVEDLF